MPMKTERIIKRYINRKLYDTRESCYITLTDIYEWSKADEPVKVILNSTQEDITAITLFDAWTSQKKAEGLTLDFVTNLIKGGK